MTSILCLAHYCDTHGPTPLMVTEELPVPCSTCLDPSSNAYPDTPLPSASLSRNPSGSFSSPTSIQLSRPHPPSPTPSTPPASPRMAPRMHRRDSSFRKTYDEADRKRAIPCENCALTLPRKVSPSPSASVSPSPSIPPATSATDDTSPILRTRKPFALVSSAASTPKHSDSDEPDAAPAPSRRRRSIPRSVTSASDSQKHTHFLDYTSSHDPSSTTTFSLLRAACLRTLSCETLPPSSPTPQPAGGPLFFGDPLAGYTTAFLFRIPDPYARGRRRVYAFLCLSVLSERKAMRVFGFLAGAFRELAGWIQGLAEASNSESGIGEGIDEEGGGGGGGGMGEGRVRSSFLGSRGDDRGRGVRSRGLAEVVGKPDFFIELHVRFVALAAQLRFLVEGGQQG
ncbi:hypothetical protein VE03_01365 [Pseudogymnoascus sp. 23342-1-I1]|nr:hypothetical protein VE03_01365 [Pseudogymnoascus sp. 23342-1-I1]